MSFRRRRLKPDSDGDKFETEGLSYLNDDEKPKSNKHKTNFDTDSEAELSGSDHSDVEDKLLLENEEADSDDDAPESVGFEDSKQAILAQFRSAMKQIDSEREKKKSQRHKIEAQFKEQKARKLESLAKVKLPEEFLEELDKEIPKKKKKSEKKKEKEQKLKDTEDQFDLDGDLDLEDELETDLHPAGTMGDDYISLTDSVSGVEVTELKYLEKKKQTLAQSAADFRQKRLYGANIRRESNSKLQAVKEKRKQMHMNKKKR